LVDVGAGGGELLGSNGGALFHCGSKSVGHHSHDFSKLISTETDEGLGCVGTIVINQNTRANA
jgi:hypothetical protein